jgi:hypothetical protein
LEDSGGRLLDSTDYETTACNPLSAQVSRHENTARKSVDGREIRNEKEGGDSAWLVSNRSKDRHSRFFVPAVSIVFKHLPLKNYQPAGFEPKKSGHSTIFLTAASFTGASDGVFACALQRCFPVLPA